MTQVDQLRDDLQFVRGAVDRHDRRPKIFTAPYYIWAVYTLVGYSLIDINEHWASWFFLIGWFPCGVATGIARHRWVRRRGEEDLAMARKTKLHFMVGSLLALGAVIGLACCVPDFRGHLPGQVCVILIGMIYFTAGVHFDRSFLVLGPMLMLGGVLVGLAPRGGWTMLGILLSAGLVIAGLISERQQSIPAEVRP